MSNQRPFEIGDMLIIETPSMIIDNPPPPEKYTAECSKVFSDGMIRVRYNSYINNHDCTVIFDRDGNAIDGHDRIVVIRKPRKGNAESRAIVAMLAREYHNYLLYTLEIWRGLTAQDIGAKQYWVQRKKGAFNIKGRTFEKAKSMLQ